MIIMIDSFAIISLHGVPTELNWHVTPNKIMTQVAQCTFRHLCVCGLQIIMHSLQAMKMHNELSYIEFTNKNVMEQMKS